jgi:antitoxin ParD1/3/4
MSKVVKRSFSLTEEQAAFIDAKVESGEYASGSEMIRAGIRGMQEDELVLHEWLRREVLPAVEELEANPELARPADEVFAEILQELEALEPKARRRA